MREERKREEAEQRAAEREQAELEKRKIAAPIELLPNANRNGPAVAVDATNVDKALEQFDSMSVASSSTADTSTAA